MHFLSLFLLLLESPRWILVIHRKILNYCYVPQQWHHELGLLRRFYARVEHKVVVGDDLFNLLTVTSLIFIRRHCGMKRPGPTLQVRLREIGSTD